MSTIEPPTKLPIQTKLAFGVGDMGPGIVQTIMAFNLMFFLTQVAGLPPSLAGMVLFIGKAWDAINDPIIGSLSDRTQTRWGRRHPWMIFGAIPLGICFFIGWIVPDFGGDIRVNPWPWFAYYTIVAILFHTFYTIVNLPYSALTPELTEDYNERTSLNSFRFAFSIGGSIFSLVLAQLLVGFIPNLETRFVVLTATCAAIAVVTIFLCVWGTEERFVSQPIQRQSVWQQFRIVLRCRPFLYVAGIYFFSWVSFQLTAQVMQFYARDWMGMSDAALLALVVQGTAIIMLFVWSSLSRRLGKQAVFLMGIPVWMIAQCLLFFLPQGEIGTLIVLCIMAGFGVSTAYLVPWSMVPDAIDLDELNTGERREGIFYAFMSFLQKLGLALGLLIVGVTLEIFGFDREATTQSASALVAIRATIGPLPAIFLTIGLFLTVRYPLTRRRHAEVVQALHERKAMAKASAAE